jgi:AraC-like DNA-binding protein
MIFVMDHSDYRKYLTELQLEIGGTFINDLYTFDPQYAEGTLRFIELLGGVQVLISDYRTKVDMTWKRISCFPEMYTLRFSYLQKFTEFSIDIENDKFIDESDNYAAIVFTSSKYGLSYSVSAGTVIKFVYTTLAPQQVFEYFPGIDITRYLQELFTNKTKVYNMVPMNFSCRQALLEIIQMPMNSPFYHLSIRARLFELTDYFFKQYLQTTQDKRSVYDKRFQEDVEKLSELDILMTQDFSAELPKIEELAKRVYMSPAKFKTIFKTVYGQSFYDYYNTSRLNKARRQIMLGESTIKEVTIAYGFTDGAHFSNAFKKCFGFAPSDVKILNH